jgi:hypothetical protein
MAGWRASPSVHDRLEWVRLEDIGGYQLLPADMPIAASLKKQEEMP